RARMLRLKGVHDIVHSKELIARKPQYQGSAGHVLERLTSDYRASVHRIELNIHLFAVRNCGHFSNRHAILRLGRVSVRGQPNKDESDDQFDNFQHCPHFVSKGFSDAYGALLPSTEKSRPTIPS